MDARQHKRPGPAWRGLCCTAAVGAALAFAAPPSAAQAPTRAVRGAVVDSATSAPVAGARVLVPALGRAVEAGPDGRFTITDLPAGIVRLRVQLIGYAPAVHEIDLAAGDAQIVVRLGMVIFELEAVSVEARSAEEERLRETQSVSTMSAEDVVHERGQTLGETIKNLPGVAVVQYGPSIAKPVIRGLHSQRVIVMNQGVRQEGQQWGGEHAPEIDAFGVHEVEVIRGAGAILYGSDALGGVVRVQPRPLPWDTGLQGEAALNSFMNNRQVAGSVLLESGHVKLPLLGKSALQGRLTRRRAGDATSPDFNLRNTGFSELNGSAAIGVQRPWGASEVRYSRFDTDLGLYTGAHVGNLDDLLRAIERGPLETDFSYGIGNPRQTVRHDQLSWSTGLTVKNLALLEFDLAYQFNRREEFDNHGPLASRDIPAFALDLHTYTVDVRAHHAEVGPLTGTVGVSGMRQGNISRGKGFLIPQYRLYTGGVYALERLSFERLTVSAGVRYDARWQRTFPVSDASIVSPEETRTYDGVAGLLGASYALGDRWSVAANLGHAWRAPNVNERFSQGVHHGTAQYEIGDTSLGVERTLSVDATIRHVGPRASLDVGAFVNRVDNYIFLEPRDPVLTIRGAFPGYNYRQTDAVLRGVDVSAQWLVVPPVRLSATGSLIRGYDRAGNPLFDMPADRLNLAVRYLAPGARWLERPYVEVGTRLVRKQDHVPPVTVYRLPTDGYALLNLEIGADRILIGSIPLEVSVAVSNLLDTSYRDYLSRYKLFVDDPGRDVVLRVRVPFGAGS